MTTDDYVGIDPCKSVCEACLLRSYCDVLLASSRVFSRALGEAT